MKTIAAVLEEIGRPLQLKSLQIPPLSEGQVLVKVAYSGLCHSQLNEIYGRKGPDKFLPHTLGHEGSGIVEQVGPGVTKVKEGDHVVLSWIAGEGKNIASTHYFDGKNRINSGAISTFLSYATISENRVIPISKNIPLKEAALLGCALPTGMGVVLNTLKPSACESLGVFGIGGIGMSSILAAKLMHVDPLIAIDICEEKLKRATQLGATHTLISSSPNFKKDLLLITKDKGLDYAVEATGKKQLMELAFQSIRAHGGLCVITGNLPQGQSIEINPYDLILGKRIIGTWGGGSQIEKDIQKYLRLYEKKTLNLSPLITHEFQLQDINEAVKQLSDSKGTVRCLIKMS